MRGEWYERGVVLKEVLRKMLRVVLPSNELSVSTTAGLALHSLTVLM